MELLRYDVNCKLEKVNYINNAGENNPEGCADNFFLFAGLPIWKGPFYLSAFDLQSTVRREDNIMKAGDSLLL